MTDVLYRWPEAAWFGKAIPKTKFYERGVTPAVRARFVAEVEGITWAYKLAESTINLPSSIEVVEIQVPDDGDRESGDPRWAVLLNRVEPGRPSTPAATEHRAVPPVCRAPRTVAPHLDPRRRGIVRGR